MNLTNNDRLLILNRHKKSSLRKANFYHKLAEKMNTKNQDNDSGNYSRLAAKFESKAAAHEKYASKAEKFMQEIHNS